MNKILVIMLIMATMLMGCGTDNLITTKSVTTECVVHSEIYPCYEITFK